MSILERLRVLDREATPGPWLEGEFAYWGPYADQANRDDALICELRNCLSTLLYALESAQWVIDCYESIEYQRPVRDLDEALRAYANARKALARLEEVEPK